MSTLEEKVGDLFVVLGVQEGDSRFDLGKANFYSIKTDGTFRLIYSHGDVYEGFENIPSIVRWSKDDEAIAVESCGWAAPIQETEDDDTAPSQHPKRRRVRLVSVITNTFETASALGFADSDEVVTDAGQARGSMADAMLEMMREILTQAK
jgi:hypothetical protein